jgi:hypothetical protein
MQLALRQQSQAFEQSGPVASGLATGRFLAAPKAFLCFRLRQSTAIRFGGRFNHKEPKMMPTANFFMPAHRFQLRRGTSEQNHCTERRRPTVEPRCELEPEQRLWKVCMETDSSNCGTIEWIAFLFFGSVAVVATVSSFSELFHLLVSGSVEHVVQALLTR